MNITLLSLSISSSYSFSPMFVGNRNNFQLFSLKNYLSSVIIYNPEQLQLEKSTFSNGYGGILYSSEDSSTDFIEKTYDNTNMTNYLPIDEKKLIVIRDCLFLTIQSNENLISIPSKITLYITSCTFQECNIDKSLLNLNSRATTISHICCSKLVGGSGQEGLFMSTNTQVGSFFKFIYSSIYGKEEALATKSVYNFGGTCAMRFQCINTSHFKLEQRDNNVIARFTSKNCLTMMMNTFLKLESEVIVIINPHDGSKEGRYNHYSGIQNFYGNKYSKAIIRFDMQESTSATLDQSIFANDVQDGEKNRKHKF